MPLDPFAGTRDVDRGLTIARQIDPDTRTRSNIDVHMRLRDGIEAAPEWPQRAAPTEIEDGAIRYSDDEQVGAPTDLMIGAEAVAIIGNSIAGHQLDAPAAEPLLDVSENAQQPRIDRPCFARPPRSEQMIRAPPRHAQRNAISAEWLDTELLASVDITEPKH